MGSGSTGIAAVHLGRRFAGNDIADESLALARRRLRSESGEIFEQVGDDCPAIEHAPDTLLVLSSS
jgi:DNA modification methylase